MGALCMQAGSLPVYSVIQTGVSYMNIVQTSNNPNFRKSSWLSYPYNVKQIRNFLCTVPVFRLWTYLLANECEGWWGVVKTTDKGKGNLIYLLSSIIIYEVLIMLHCKYEYLILSACVYVYVCVCTCKKEKFKLNSLIMNFNNSNLKRWV